MSDRNEAVVSRLNQLEKANRRMKVLGLAALALFGMAATQNHSTIVDYQRLGSNVFIHFVRAALLE